MENTISHTFNLLGYDPIDRNLSSGDNSRFKNDIKLINADLEDELDSSSGDFGIDFGQYRDLGGPEFEDSEEDSEEFSPTIISEVTESPLLIQSNKPATQQSTSDVQSSIPEAKILSTPSPPSLGRPYQGSGKIKYKSGVTLDNMDPSLVGFVELLNKKGVDATVTSAFRSGSKTKQNKTSPHADGRGLDITGDFNEIKKAFQDPEIRAYAREHGINILDETIPEIMKKTGATGKHFHLEKSISPSALVREHTKLMFGRIGGILKAQQGIITVKPGDNLSTLSKKNDVLLDSMMSWNNITNPNLISSGQQLIVKDPSTYWFSKSLYGSNNPEHVKSTNLGISKMINIARNNKNSLELNDSFDDAPRLISEQRKDPNFINALAKSLAENKEGYEPRRYADSGGLYTQGIGSTWYYDDAGTPYRIHKIHNDPEYAKKAKAAGYKDVWDDKMITDQVARHLQYANINSIDVPTTPSQAKGLIGSWYNNQSLGIKLANILKNNPGDKEALVRQMYGYLKAPGGTAGIYDKRIRDAWMMFEPKTQEDADKFRKITEETFNAGTRKQHYNRDVVSKPWIGFKEKGGRLKVQQGFELLRNNLTNYSKGYPGLMAPKKNKD